MPKLNVIKQDIFFIFQFIYFFLADVQEEKLVVLTTEINAKQKCLEMLENARKRSDLIRQRYEERIKTLSERIQNAEDEKQAAVTKLSKFILNSFYHFNVLVCFLFRFNCT
jgi:F0F1-type ATP synthase membrane subunit b/b'